MYGLQGFLFVGFSGLGVSGCRKFKGLRLQVHRRFKGSGYYGRWDGPTPAPLALHPRQESPSYWVTGGV